MRPLFVFIALALTGCVSNHDLKRDGFNYLGGGGGFIDDEVHPGLYSIKAFSNLTLWSFVGEESAKVTFLRRADALCGPKGYTIVNYNVKSYVSTAPVSFMAGHVLCAGSGLTVEAAKEILSLD